MFLEIQKFILYTGLIVIISKFVLAKTIRKLAENLNLKPKKIGDIAGYTTSIPELLTVCISSINGLVNTSIFNILSSNIINFAQYLFSIYVHKNRKVLGNVAIRINIVMVIITILIPLILIWKDVKISLNILPIFLILYVLFLYLNRNVHRVYFEKENNQIEKKIKSNKEKNTGNTSKVVIYVFILLISAVWLYILGELLGNTLNNLCNQFEIPQSIVGILLGFVTSIPELTTFFESQNYYKKSKEDEMMGVVEATSNLLTSNILNLFIIQSIGMVILFINH